MKCHAGVQFPDGKPCPKCGAKLGEVCWPGINADLLELKKLREQVNAVRVAGNPYPHGSEPFVAFEQARSPLFR